MYSFDIGGISPEELFDSLSEGDGSSFTQPSPPMDSGGFHLATDPWTLLDDPTIFDESTSTEPCDILASCYTGFGGFSLSSLPPDVASGSDLNPVIDPICHGQVPVDLAVSSPSNIFTTNFTGTAIIDGSSDWDS